MEQNDGFDGASATGMSFSLFFSWNFDLVFIIFIWFSGSSHFAPFGLIEESSENEDDDDIEETLDAKDDQEFVPEEGSKSNKDP